MNDNKKDISLSVLSDVLLAEYILKKEENQLVERTHSWLNRFRRILIRWEKKADNYLALLLLACAVITYQRAEVSG